MDFTLYYRGNLPSTGRSKGKPEHKHKIRIEFHRQLRKLWTQPPLDYYDTLHGLEVIPSLGRRVAGHHFVFLVGSSLKAFVDLNVTMLRPGPHGEIVSAGGDVDNRLKTLFDALSLPQENQIPGGWTPAPEEVPFFCLLEDDRLISGLSVSTEQLLLPSVNSSEVIVLVSVKTRISHLTGYNHFLG